MNRFVNGTCGPSVMQGIKSDKAPAIKALSGRVRGMRSRPTIMEEPLEYEPQANGLAECCVQTSKALCHTARGAIDTRMGGISPADHPVLAWIVRHPAPLCNRYYIGADGRTPLERVAGNRSDQLPSSDGESGSGCRRPDKARQCAIGMWLRFVARFDRVYSRKGVALACTVMRTGGHERWRHEDALAAKGTTRQPDLGRDGDQAQLLHEGERHYIVWIHGRMRRV